MKILWGDLHNHCGITYGIGSLENALKASQYQLDFVSVTPHAFWPDMPARDDETAFLIDFHERGFQKIAANWNHVKKRIDEANIPGTFTTFFSYEMHSSRWGDHHFVSPDPDMKLAYAETPAEVLGACGVRAIAVPHHIGYTPGYRGINWEGFDESISPIIEVLSKHGCAMHAQSGFPYYHDMGPLDPRNTIFEGLSAGKRFGFAASTDHHAGFPGSYGDGRLAVWADENSRESIFDAILNRRTYAVSGAKIACSFRVNGAPMGACIPRSGVYEIEYTVEASGMIDRVIIFRDNQPVHITDGWLLPETGRRFKLCMEMGWGDNIADPYEWNVHMDVSNGAILGCEPCLRGKSVLSPKQGVEDSDAINRLNFRMQHSASALDFIYETYRNNSTLSPSTALMIVEIEGTKDTFVRFEINGMKFERKIGELCKCGFSGHVRSYNAQAFKLHTAIPCGKYMDKGALRIEGDADRFHMEVRQFDGNTAYVSPVFIDGRRR